MSERAARFGVADRYHSFYGDELHVPEPVLERALACMGAQDAPTGDAGLPPVQVVREGDAIRLRWHGQAAGARWQLLRESTQEHVAEGEVWRDHDAHIVEIGTPLGPDYYRLRIGDAADDCLLVVAPRRCWAPAPLLQGERWWGCTIQLYALRSTRNWGIGDFGDLRRLVDAAARQGASFIGLSPLHALFPHQPDVASPYSPSSRSALNPIYLDVQALLEQSGSEEARARVQSDPFQDTLRALRDAEFVDYPGVAAAKGEVLQQLWRVFTARPESDTLVQAFAAYAESRARTTGRHALFEAIQEHLHAQDPAVWGWPAWPEAWRAPEGETVRRFAQEHGEAVRYRLWLQWQAERQLDAVQRYAKSRGMGIGLYCDLAVGVNGGGAETWAQPQMYALGMHAGAPPDPLNALGQDWGLPPLNPLKLREGRYQPFIDTLRATMRHCGALRMDHVMALMRLFWTADGQGTYITYPLEDLLGILALESHRHECMVIGEDLGNVAPRMREAMRDACLLSYKPLLFERTEDGSFRPPAQWQPQALAVVSTHDLPTLRGFWLGEDIELLGRLALYPSQHAHEEQVLNRAQDRARLLFALQHEGLLPEGTSVQPTSLPDATPAFVDAVYAYLARTPCWLVGLQLEDLTGQTVQVNVPGTTEERFPNWRRKLSVGVDELAADARWLSLTAALRTQRGGPVPLDGHAESLPPLHSAIIPGATYRIQLHKGCSFEDVTRAVPYLHALGVSHLYSSPYLRARPGSTHGYDIIDHGAVNPEIGDAQQHARLCNTLRRHGMGQVLDIVPNHMGVLEADNAWWLDVLEHGRASPHAQTFDIEWFPAAAEMEGRLLLPVLGDHYGRVLEAGEIRLHFLPESGEFELRYWDHRFPVDPAHYPEVLATLPPPVPHGEEDSESHAIVAALLDAFGRLPDRNVEDEAQRHARVRDSAVFKKSLARLAARHAWLPHWIAACVNRLNGQPGDSASFDLLDALIARQAYRLAHWRVASDDVNYRRFFDVNTLAALRMERTEVFEATHRKVLHWLQDGLLDGLRIDHPDGLSDPQQYFEQLQRRYALQREVAGHNPRALYLLVEKIQAEHEQLPDSWPVHGDTGYRFAALVNGLFVDARHAQAFDTSYHAFTGEDVDYEDIVYRCKKLIIETSLFSELNWLTQALHGMTHANRRRSDFTRNRLRVALAETAAAFPVYRTYLRAGEPPGAADRQHVDWAIAAAKRRLGGSEATVLDHLREVLLGEGEAVSIPDAQRARFLARWQQFTAPVTAKSVEDTAFYRFVRLLSLNDVGGEPSRFGVSVAAFHGANVARLRHRPHCLLGGSTHDSKRSEDVRARINVLSEQPAAWEELLQRLSGWAEMYLSHSDDGEAMPSRNDVWMFFQTLVGVWPAHVPDETEREALRNRMQAYMLKAAREAKLHTQWTCPDTAYEDALARYVDSVLRPADPNPFADELQRFTQRIALFGFHNSLSQLALKMTAPGVPDIYQGCERWNFSLVDPDNRRPVDFDALALGLEELRAACNEDGIPAPELWDALHASIHDGRVKQLATWRLLQLRRAHEGLFRDGYAVLQAEGPQAEHLVGYARYYDDMAVLVIVARFTHTLCGGDAKHWEPRLWTGTQLRPQGDAPVLRRFQHWRNWLTGERVASGDDGMLAADSVFAGAGHLPFAVLVSEKAQ